MDKSNTNYDLRRGDIMPIFLNKLVNNNKINILIYIFENLHKEHYLNQLDMILIESRLSRVLRLFRDQGPNLHYFPGNSCKFEQTSTRRPGISSTEHVFRTFRASGPRCISRYIGELTA